MASVSKRTIFMIGGYEPKSSDAFFARTVRELARYEKTWDVRSHVVSKGDSDDGNIANIQLHTQHEDGEVDTNWNFLVWNGIVLGDFAKPFWYRIGRYWLTFADYVVTGTFFKMAWHGWRFSLYFLYPAAMHALFIAAGLLAGRLVAQSGFAGSSLLGWAVGIAVALGLWRVVGERYHVRHLGDLWAFSRNYLRGYRKDAEARLDHLASLIVQRAQMGIDDEILLIGHSTGGGLILDAAARALALDPQLGTHGPRIQIFTVGSTALKIGLHPAAHAFRTRVQTLADAPDIHWTEWQARADIINLHGSHPVAAMKLRPRRGEAFPVRLSVRLRAMVPLAQYMRIRRNYFRLHYQFIMGNTKRYHFDFYEACCGTHHLGTTDEMTLRETINYDQ